MANNIDIGRTLESNLPADGSGITGKVYLTDKQNMYVIDNNKNKLKISDVIVVSTLPTIGQPFKIYILSSQNYSMNYYDGSWHTLGSNQIIIGTSNSDTSKLWLDTTSTTSPLLKWHNGTTWISISGTVDTSTLLDKTTYKGSADGIVKKADTLTGLSSTSSQIDNTVNNSHTHPNKTYLDKISEDSNGKPIYNGNSMGGDATSINGITIDNSTRSNGRVLTYNNIKNDLEYADVTISGVVGSSQITTIENTTIGTGIEKVFNHPISSNIVVSIEEQFAGNSVTDTHVDFSDISKYTLQDSNYEIINNRAQLKKYNNYPNAISYDGTSSYTEVLYNSLYAPTTVITIEILAYMSSWNTATTMSLISKAQSGGYIINMNGTANSGYLCFGVYANGSYKYAKYLLASLSNGWHRICGKYDGRYCNLYIDGVLVNSNDLGGTYTIGYTYNNSLIIGADAGTGTGVDTVSSSPQYATCRLTDIRLWNIAVSDTNIAKYSFSPLNGNETGLVGYWKMNENSGTILTDSSGHVNATGYNINWITDSSITQYNGIYSTTPLYLKTTGLSDFSLTTTDTITSLTIPNTTPTNTSIKCLFSVDNYTTYLYYDGTSIKKFTGDLTLDWGSTSSSIVQIQNLFTNLTMTNLTSMLSSLGITPINLDVVFQLYTSDNTVTPTILPITMIYITKTHTEFASFGGYDESYPKFSVKRINNSQLSVRNNTNKTRTINVNLVTSV